MNNRQYNCGFTLAELLIALAILGVIATFTIPKILASQQDSKYNAVTKEAVAMVAAAYSQYKLANPGDTGASISDLTPYMNFISVDSTSTIDSTYGNTGTRACNVSSGRCLRLHSGAFLQYWPADYFGGTATTNGIPILIDPDGTVTTSGSPATGQGKTMVFSLYYDGRIRDNPNILTGTTYNNGANTSNPGTNPPWFSW